MAGTKAGETHTPAPWHIKPFGVGLDIEDAHGADLAFVRPVRDLTEAFANARLIIAAPDLFAVARAPVVHTVEESEGVVRLAIGGVEVCAWVDGTPQAAALLQFDAEQRAAIRLATTGER